MVIIHVHCLFICLEFFTIAGEGFQILTNDRHLWPWSGEGSLTSHTGHPFIMVIPEDF